MISLQNTSTYISSDCIYVLNKRFNIHHCFSTLDYLSQEQTIASWVLTDTQAELRICIQLEIWIDFNFGMDK